MRDIQKWRMMAAALLIALFMVAGNAQYFGKNKPRYRSFDFKVYETQHFDVYHYLKNKERVDEISQWLEQWYGLHQAILQDTIQGKNPFILYNNHADFQQTNAIMGSVGVGTGGVTEAFKNRIILPITMTNQQLHHVVGHELVHAFQYNIILNGDSTSLQSLQNLPLFMVEGLAEYLSIGRNDAHTAMWMRDAVLNDKIPSLEKLYNPKFFPYRYGQVFWSFMTGMYGDEVVRPLFENTAIYGLETAVDSLLHIDFDTLSNVWIRNIKKYYTPYIGDGKERTIGKKLIDDSNAGYMNISPVLSPNGRYVIFLSEKNLFTTDLFLADARKGKIIRKITSISRDGHLDHLNYLESAGTWSPNSKQFAFVAFKKGKNVLVIKDVDTGKTTDEIRIKDVPAFTNPAWSPDGRSIVVSGLVEGQTDLYTLDLRTKRVSQLTDDVYAEIQPSWSADGQRLVFSSDQQSMQRGRNHGKWTLSPAVMEVSSGHITHLDIFEGADNLNPVFDHEGNILLLSDRDGYRNMYKYDVESDSIFQLTDFLTGISGITKYSPAISASRKRDRVLYTHYFDGKYTIYQSAVSDLLNRAINDVGINQEAAVLPIVNANKSEIVNSNLNKLDRLPLADTSTFNYIKYKPHFKLDYATGSTSAGVGNSGTFGSYTGGAGGVFLLFSDILGNNQLMTNLSMNGEIYDFGGSVAYINRKNPIAWGIGGAHYPTRTGWYSISLNQRSINGVDINTYEENVDILRIFQDQLNVFGQYPLSVTRRVEGSVGATYRYLRQDRYTDIYSFNTQTGRREFYITSERVNVPVDPLYQNLEALYYNASAAYVGDNAHFGMASPMHGHRYRAGLSKYFGEYDFFSGTLDYRHYYWLKPVSFAFRIMHFTQFGRDANIFYPISVGQMGLVRGFDYNHIDRIRDRHNITINDISGSKIVVTGFEIRLPFTGVDRLALIKTNFLMSELAWFVDGGLAFDEYDNILIDVEEGEPGFENRSVPVFSTGLSVRINLFGALIVEPYWAWALEKNSKAVFGFNFVPGW